VDIDGSAVVADLPVGSIHAFDKVAVSAPPAELQDRLVAVARLRLRDWAESGEAAWVSLTGDVKA
jgi:hypothetical protein